MKFRSLTVAFLLLALVNTAFAQSTRTLAVADGSFTVGAATSTRVVFADNFRKRMININPETENFGILSYGLKVVDMSTSFDRQKVLVAGGTSGIRIYNPSTGSWVAVTLPSSLNGKAILSIAQDANNRIYLSTDEGWGKLYQLTMNGSTVTSNRQFGTGADLSGLLYKGARLRTDPTGKYLVVGTPGISPYSLHLFDVSGSGNPSYLADNNFLDAGSNLQDMVVTANARRIYIVSGSPYVLTVFDGTTRPKLTLLPSRPMESYPAAVALSNDGRFVYGSPTSTYVDYHVYKYNTYGTEVKRYVLSRPEGFSNPQIQSRGLVLSPDGSKLFVVHGEDDYGGTFFGKQKIQIFDTFEANLSCEEMLDYAVDLSSQLCAIALSSPSTQTRQAAAGLCQ